MELRDFALVVSLFQLFGAGDGSASCGVLGTLSGVICVSETQFMLSLSDGQVFDCPSTTWCADHPEICVQDGEPACRLNKDCGVCHPNATTSCVSQKTYASCTDGILDTNIRYCQASKPYCSMRYNDDVLGVVCTNIIMQIACDPNSTPSPPPDPEPSPDPEPEPACTEIGKFPITTDPNCKTYYYCYPDTDENGKDVLKREDFVCPYETVYNPQVGKCVVSKTFVCTNGNT